MDIQAVLIIFKFLFIGVEVIHFIIRRKEEKTLDAEIIKRLELLENKVKELKP